MATNPDVLNMHEHVRRVAGMLLAREGRRQRYLAEILGTTLQTANNKMRGETLFKAHEIKLMAMAFGEDVAVFYDPDRPIGTTPVLPPVPDPAPGLLTSTKYQFPLLSGVTGAFAQRVALMTPGFRAA